MKTQEKIKTLCMEKYQLSISVYEKKLGYSNGSLSKDGVLRSDRLLAVARDLGVSMESLMDDDLLDAYKIDDKASISFSQEETDIISAYRRADSLTKAMILRTLGMDRVEKRDVG